MKLNLKTKVLDFAGKEIPQRDEHGKIDPELPTLDFETVLVQLMDLRKPGESLTMKDQITAFKIGTRIAGAKKEVDLTTDQIAYIKSRLEIFHGPIVYGRFSELLGDLKSEEPDSDPA